MVVPHTRGDINPYLILTRRLVEQGHEVSWLSLPEDLRDFAALPARVGATVLPSPPIYAPPLPRGKELARVFADPLAFVQLQQRVAAEAPTRIEHVRAILRDVRPDVVASDRAFELLPMIIASELEGIPHAIVSSSLIQLAAMRPLPAFSAHWAGVQEEFSNLWGSIRSLFRRYRVPARMAPGEIFSVRLNTAFTTEAFVGSAAKAGSTRSMPMLVGPCIDPEPTVSDFPWQRLRSDGRVVYVSFGSLFDDDALLAVIAEAAALLDIQLVIGGSATGGFADRQPGSVIAVPYAPQLEMLGKARAFVTHGGLNSVNESLFQGTPMLLIPQALDQAIQAECVRTSRVGVSMDREHALHDIDACRAALAALISPVSSQRDAVLRVKESYRANDGVKKTCDLLLDLAGSRRSPPPSSGGG